MFLRHVFFPAILFCSTAAFAATEFSFAGTYHNDRMRHRATLVTGNDRYALDFQGSDLYHVGERYDRENVVVEGAVDYYPRNYDMPVIRVEKITFRPYRGRSVTYTIMSRQYYTATDAQPERRIQTEPNSWDSELDDAATNPFIE